jgi:hypothetical protein
LAGQAIWGGRRGGLVLGLLVAVAVLFGMYSSFKAFSDSLDEWYGLKTADDRAEVRYRIGPPIFVQAPNDPVWYADAVGEGITPIPTGKKPDDYPMWIYTEIEGGLVLVQFAGTRLSSVECFMRDTPNGDCKSIAGIWAGEHEDSVLQALGRPTSSRIDGERKTLAFDDIGLSVTLIRAEVVGMRRQFGQEKAGARLRRWSFFKP